MADRTPESSASAVRDAAHLIAAAEELLAIAHDPVEAATYIGTIADAAKALRANHLADALEHVRYRATRSAEIRRSGWLISEPIRFDDQQDSDGQDWGDQDAPSEPEAEGRAARHEAAVDALVSEPDEPHTNDPEVLRARVHGDDDG